MRNWHVKKLQTIDCEGDITFINPFQPSQLEEFYLHPKSVFQILADKGVTHFYHANTVLTSLTFINQKALLSRSFVENNGLIQTEQKSDTEDKTYNVWDDVFLDGLDLHKKYRRANKYGPILFVIKLELLLAPSLPPLLVTKNNPWFWKSQEAWTSRYYNNHGEVEADYLTGHLDSRIMFTLRSPGAFIKLNKYLRGIVIDKPTIIVDLKTGEKKNVGDRAYERIHGALNNNGLGHIPIKHRHADDNFHLCSCNFNYTWLKNWNHQEFFKRYRST